ncbi:hypothetical protein LCGC14_1082810 [marine sediment metagenome]|uniref:Uncharacterized protein n=1 Tax=marine sediment metagenome TaxID=412755 RepID=A0A0F9N2D1_9ZZZZ
MPVGDRDITLFAGGSGGYGWAVNPGADVYHWVLNMSCRIGRADLVPGPASFGNQTISYRPPVMIDWEDSDGVPLLLVPGGLKGDGRVVKITDGATTLEDSGGGTEAYTGAVLYQHDDSDADTEVAYFCNGTGEGALRIRNKAGTYNTIGTATADQLYVIGSDLWRVIDSYKLEKVVLGTFPGTEANWTGIRTRAGTAAYGINKVLEMGGSPLVFKGEGVFRYNAAPSTARFENLTPFVPAHPDNGKGGFADGRGRFYYPTITGRILVISFGSQSQQGPLRFQWIDRDTPFGRISLMTADEEFIYAVIDPGAVKTQQLGLIVKSDDGGVFTTHTNKVTDQEKATNANVSALAVGNTDFIYIGSDEPFWGPYFEMHTVSELGQTHAWAASYSAGSGSWTAFDEQDSTLGLREDGAITLDPTADVYAGGTWVTDTVDSQANKYWIRLSPNSALTSAKIAEVYLIPYRPSYDTTDFPELGAALAQAVPKVLVGHWQGQRLVWHDWIAPLAPRPFAMTVSRTKGTNSVGEQTLHLYAGPLVYSVPVGPDADPVRSAWPQTNGIPHAIGFSGHNFGLPVNIKSVQTLVVHGGFLQADDECWVFWRWDNGDRWHKDGPHAAFPIVINDLADRGRELHVGVRIKDATRDAVAPYITHAIIPEGEWTDEGALHEALGQDIASPQGI